MSIQPFSKTTLGKMAACEALSLSYWADHPAPNCVWAVDDNQQAHVVRVYRKTGEAAVQDVAGSRRVIEWQKQRGEYILKYVDKYSMADAGDRVKVA